MCLIRLSCDLVNVVGDRSHGIHKRRCRLHNKAQNDPNFKYDPVNVGTYNYCGYEEGIEFVYSYDETKVKNSSSDDHQKYDVKPYLGGKKSYSNWGNVPGLIYGNTRAQRDKNGDYHDISVLKDKDDKDLIYKNWSEVFENH